MNNRGNAWRGKGEYDKAIEDYSKVILLNPDFAAAWNNRGNIWSGKEEYDKAIDDYSEAIRLEPDYVEAWNNRGNAWSAKDEQDRAITDFDQALRLAPGVALIWNNRGASWSKKGEYDRAIADFDEALRLDPDNKNAIHNRAFAQATQISEARSEVTTIKQQGRDVKEPHKEFDDGYKMGINYSIEWCDDGYYTSADGYGNRRQQNLEKPSSLKTIFISVVSAVMAGLIIVYHLEIYNVIVNFAKR